MEILIWIITAYGFTNIMVYGSIFEGFRNRIKRWGENSSNPLEGFFKFISGILSCMMCCSTWIGFFLGFLIYSPFNHYLKLGNSVSWFFDGLLASGGVWVINSIVEWYEENRPTNK